MKEQLKAVQRMQEYILRQLETDITLVELSKVSFFHPGTPTGCSEST